ncbi:sushi, von Willebrand factor type A, EGF and pentraxin domain-containing protein 1-like, partial [Physella acuta]|uniref:sushi, von Willebrand factor type A, EGF and pentraxin domain-containing protein 1-like n=1 Tax=Physella acuta TaxID=109671 RepID=UPI0027DD4820
ITCPPPTTTNGNFNCPSHHYQSMCVLTCDDGYQTRGDTQVTCQADKTWSRHEQCQDALPPQINCLPIIETFAGPKRSPTPVTWVTPSVSDNSGVSLTVSSDVASGSKFSVGRHTVTFTATDDARNWGTCRMAVSVKIIFCPEYLQPNDSDVSCSHGNEYGSECVTTCHQGYELANLASDRQECQENRTWSDDVPVCIPRSCDPPRQIVQGNFTCPLGHVFRHVCHLQCNHGYQITGPANITCGITVQWSHPGICLDVSAPYFPAGCTDHMKVEAASLGEPTYVIYQLPEVQDNSGMEVTVTGYPVSGSSFSLGTTEVTVTATDLEGNSDNCSFSVLVEYVYCDPPSIDLSGKNLIQYTCPDRHVMGASCGLSCQDGNPVFGASSIRCQRDTDGNLTWAWSGTTRPYCDDGIPYSGATVETEFTYFTSSCDANNEEIKQLFLSRLNKSGLMSECAESGCKLSGIRVTCGPVTGRNRGRRDATPYMYQITVTIDLGQSGEETEPSETLDHYQNLANSLDDKLYALDNSGQLEIPEIGEFQSLASSGVKYVCNQPGTKFVYSSALCAGCGPGHMYDNTTNSCRVCPKDTYQDQDISFSCTPCPNNTVTQSEMATSEALCLDLCRPGQFSHNGIQLCDPCPVGSYQSKYGMKSCDLCPYSMSTLNMGTINVDDCLFFNTRLSETTSQAAIQIFDKIPTSFTFMTWVNSASTLVTSSLTFSLGSDQDNSTAAFLALDKIVVAIHAQEDVGGVKVIRRWNHIALSYKSGIVSLYVNGYFTDQRSGYHVTEVSQKSLTFGSSLESGVSAVVVSGLQLTTSFYTELQLREFATSCHKKVKTNLLARKPWEFLSLSPSTCNDVNVCEGEPCGKHGTCISGLDTLQCLCHTPWSGDRCQVAPDFCADNLCANGATCINMPDDNLYRCQCAPGYFGTQCNSKREIIDGSWGNWAEWSECSVTCESGTRSRTRECDSPAPRDGGEACRGHSQEYTICVTSCTNCLWGSWSPWKQEVTCGSGFEISVRNKINARNGGLQCSGNAHLYRMIHLPDCPVNGQFGHWSPWSECSASCGGGVSSRSRACDNPPPKNGGLPCTHSLARESRTCNEQTCRVCPVPEPRTNWKSWNCTDLDGDMTSCNRVQAWHGYRGGRRQHLHLWVRHQLHLVTADGGQPGGNSARLYRQENPPVDQAAGYCDHWHRLSRQPSPSTL